MDNKPKLCMGCMAPIGDETICPECGYAKDTPHLPSYLEPKTVLNERYIVGKILSYNGEGCIYLGYDLVTNAKVQIKEFFPDTLCTRILGSDIVTINPNKLVQFKNLMSEYVELNKTLLKMRTLSQVWAALDHFVQNNTTYFVFENIEGKTLKRYLQDKGGELTWQEVKKLFPPIFTTLSLLHNSSLVHRGLSLDTIYVTETDELKIADFCTLSERSSGSDIIPEMFPGYSAPEQYSSNEWQGPWTDVYSISAVLYRVLTGCMPTEAISRLSNDSLMSPHEVNENIPTEISNVIMDGLKLKGQQRIQNITELVTGLFKLGDRKDIPRTTTSTVIIPKLSPKVLETKPQPKKKMSSSKVFLIVMAVTLTVMILLAVFILIFLTNDNDDNNSSSSAPNPQSSSEYESELDSSSIEDSSSLPESSFVEKESIEIPEFVGSIADGLNSYYTESFNIVPTFEYSEKYANGVIFEQDVKSGTSLEVGSTINIKVSMGSKYITIPDYAGLKLTQYKELLKGTDIVYEVKEIIDEGYAYGYVCKLSIEPNEKYDKTSDEKLIIYWSSYSPPEEE